ncbi:MAG: SHOCT domain-containing protein [Gaiellaceae bacterium]
MSGPTPTAATPPRRARPKRTILVWIVLGVAGLLLLLTAFAVWVDRVALNTDVFVDTSTELIEDDAIRTAVATRAVDELFASVDVEAEAEEILPEDYKGLSGPAAAGLREASYTLASRALEQPRLQRLWALSLEQSHRTLVTVLEGGGDTVSAEGGVVTLDLRLIILETADRIGIREQVEGQLPADVGRIEILQSDELDTAQDAFQLLNTLAWVLPLLTLGTFALALWLAGDRRRAVRRIGIITFFVGLLGLVAANVVGNYVVDSLVSETETRAAAGNVWDILTELLRHSFRWLIVIGLLFVVAAWLAGPGRRALAVRRTFAPFVRERVWAYAGLAVVALILLLTGPVGDFTRFLVVVTLVALGAAWIELIRRQTMAEFPGASAPAVWAELRTRATSWWDAQREAREARAQPPPTHTGATHLTARLTELAGLHASGALTDEEYAAAKTRVLAGD